MSHLERDILVCAQHTDRASYALIADLKQRGTLAAAVFGFRLSAEPPFVDESAYLSQAYFADLWMVGDLVLR